MRSKRKEITLWYTLFFSQDVQYFVVLCHVHPPNTGNSLYIRIHLVKKLISLVFFQIYFASEEYGLDSTVTCGGYFLMADVFAKQGKMPVARSLNSAVK